MSKFDPTAQMTAANMLDRKTLREYTKAVSDRVMADIVNDHLSRPTSLPSVPAERNKTARVNIQEATPVQPVPGIALCDEICDAFARRDRAELARQLGVKDLKHERNSRGNSG